MNKPNCYACIHRRGLVGDARSECRHPVVEDGGGLSALAGVLHGVQAGAARDLDIKASAHGIKNGWFLWPVNFDPVWLERCTGFEAKRSEDEERERKQEKGE